MEARALSLPGVKGNHGEEMLKRKALLPSENWRLVERQRPGYPFESKTKIVPVFDREEPVHIMDIYLNHISRALP